MNVEVCRTRRESRKVQVFVLSNQQAISGLRKVQVFVLSNQQAISGLRYSS